MPMNSGTSHVKSIMLCQKLAAEAGPKAFGTQDRPVDTTKCSCGAPVMRHKAKCSFCGKPRNP